jgi:DNA processing protein
MTESTTNPSQTRSLSEEQVAALRLSQVVGIGPKLFQELIDHFGSATKVLKATPTELREVNGIGQKVARAIVMAESEIQVDELLQLCQKNSIQIIFRNESIYPRLLSEIHDPPNLMYIRGTLLPSDQIAIAIVGSRHATNYGIQTADKFARGLSLAGFTIVSGLARGIDQAAHRGALAAGGRTLAVLGSGVLDIYPPEHDELAREIQNQGAILSELHPLAAPRGSAFPQRNRIVTGLCLGTIVVEAGERSGALISARMAMEQGREVFAVPGRIDSRMSQGCHRLIRDGAKLIQNVDDVLEEFGPLVAPVKTSPTETVRHPAEFKLNERETTVLQAIETHPTSIDEIVAKTQLPVHHILATISALEMRRLVKRISGSSLVRV